MTDRPDDSTLEEITQNAERSGVTSELLVRYLADECTDLERATIDSWRVNAPPSDRIILDLPLLLKTYARRTTRPSSPNNIVLRADAIIDSRAFPNSITPKSSSIPSVGLSRGRIPRIFPISVFPKTIAIAATAAVALGLVFAGWQAGVSRFGTEMNVQASSYATAAGERNTIVLPDGSSVVLSVASRLDVPANYGIKDRVLHLSGEALFTVASASDQPFVVHAGNTATRVLGTSFSVRHYDTDTAVSVAVRDGKVAVGTTVLTARQQVLVGARVSSPVTVIAPERFDFVTGLLTIDNMPISDAVIELSRWYNVDIRVGAPELNSLRMKGQFKSESVADLAVILEWSLGVRVVRDGRTLTLYPES